MAHITTIQVYRGVESGLPTLAAGEPGFTTDTYKLFIGDGATNHQIGGGTGTVTSVALSNPGAAFITVGGSPVTTSGTITQTWTGTTGDLLYCSATDTWSKLAAGTNGHVLKLAGGVPTWAAASGTGDVVGPASSTNRGIAVYDGTTGKLLETTSVTIDVSNNILGVTTINKVVITQPATGSTLQIADGKAFVCSNTITLAGTDGNTLNIGDGATLSALAGTAWAANTLAIGSGAGTVAQVSFAANKFPARASTGNLVAKDITDFALTILDDANAAAVRTTIGAGTGSGDAFVADPLSQFAATTSAQLAGVISDETGSGALVFGTSPTLVTPLLGTPTSGTLTNCTGLPIGGITMNTARLLGRTTAGAGVAEEITVGTGLSLSAGSLTATGGSTPNYSAPSGFRLTTESGVPVSTSNRTAQGTLYLAIYTADYLLIPNAGATDFDSTAPGSLSLSLTLTSGKNYDVFCWNNGGTPTLALSSAWTNNTTRADALGTLKGVTVNNATIGSMGAKRGIWLGTIRASGSNVTADAAETRYIWNAYNRVKREVLATTSTSSWTVGNDVWQGVNCGGTVYIQAVFGASREAVDIYSGIPNVGDAAGSGYSPGIGLDSVGNNAQIMLTAINSYSKAIAHYAGVQTPGYHYFQWTEQRTTNAGTPTAYNYYTTLRLGGIWGFIWC